MQANINVSSRYERWPQSPEWLRWASRSGGITLACQKIRLRMVRVLLLSLRTLRRTSGFFLLLLCSVRLCLLLRGALLSGFRRFVAHNPKGKVCDGRRQP